MFFDKAIKSCCIAGQNDIPESKRLFVESRIKEEIQLALSDGFTRFITKLDNDCDLLFTQAVLEFKKENRDITLEAFFPFRNSIEKKERKYKEKLGEFKVSWVINEECDDGCYVKANKQMLENSERLIAVYSEAKVDNVFSAITYANMHNIKVITIEI